MSAKFRTRYGEHLDVGISTPEPTRAKQAFKEDADVNNIVRRFQKTGLLPNPNGPAPMYGDFSEPVQLQEALDIVNRANEQFDSLPAHVRKRFHNSPQEFLEFTHDASNQQEMEKLGLFSEEAVSRVKAAKQRVKDKDKPPKNPPESPPVDGQATK